ncbi:MAG: hypothetical protein HYX80_08825 [Chloroflexi bacterium]|nr:hypothetical protein [Chloroflexota bacterium]
MAEKDKVYKCLNPAGIQQPIELFPLAPRLDSIDGKEIYISMAGEPDVNIALEKRLKADYPDVNWKTKKTYQTNAVPLSEEEMKTTDAVIQSVVW